MSEHFWPHLIASMVGSCIGCWIALWAKDRFGWFQ